MKNKNFVWINRIKCPECNAITKLFKPIKIFVEQDSDGWYAWSEIFDNDYAKAMSHCNKKTTAIAGAQMFLCWDITDALFFEIEKQLCDRYHKNIQDFYVGECIEEHERKWAYLKEHTDIFAYKWKSAFLKRLNKKLRKDTV